MKKLDSSNYTFSASAKTVTLAAFATVGLGRILLINNATRGVVIYDPSQTTTKGVLVGSTLTLDFDTTSHADTDKLSVFYEDANPLDVAIVTPSILQTEADQTDDLLRMLSRIVKLLESNAVVDQQQRQRVVIEGSLPVGTNSLGNLGTVTSVTTCATVSSVTNIAANAGMDREQYINIARTTYNTGIRTQLQFV